MVAPADRVAAEPNTGNRAAAPLAARDIASTDQVGTDRVGSDRWDEGKQWLSRDRNGGSGVGGGRLSSSWF
jgi:hypothetical protein